ncbi:peptidoglycan DD-metalloendopeptidase family protein [Agromyces bauzanensis]
MTHQTPTAAYQPTAPTPPSVAPSHPTPGTAAASPAPRRRTAHQPPLQTPEAEQADRPVGRSSASAVFTRRESTRRDSDSGFDALFAGFGDDDEPDEAPRGNGGRPARSGRPNRADRKAAKAAKVPKAAKPAKTARGGAAGPRRSGAMPTPPVSAAADLAALVGGTAASGATASPAAQAAGSTAGFAAALSAAAGVSAAAPTSPAPAPAEPRSPAPAAPHSLAPTAPRSLAPAEPRSPAPAPLAFDPPARRNAAAEPFGFATDVAAEPVAFGTDAAADLFGFTTDPAVEREVTASSSSAPEGAGPTPTPTRRGDASRAPLDPGSATPQRPSRDERRMQQVARDNARSSGPRTAKVRVRVSTRPQSRPVASVTVRRRGSRFVASLVAMSFAALLAVATTIPSLSLLSPEDVQALALSSTNAPGLDGQRVELNGDIVAQSVQREGYESQTIEEYARAAGIRPEATFTNNPLGTIQWPFAVGVHIGDRFGYRDCWGCSSNHGGQDFNPGLGAEIQAIADGVVSVSTDAGGSLGVVMMIDHMINGELITSVYAHMEYDSRRFEVGDTVYVGDIVGTTGDTGMSTGPHLHFEIRVGGVDGTKVDPLEWLYANTN